MTCYVLKRMTLAVHCPLLAAMLHAQNIDQVALTSGCKFHTGDDPEWKSPFYDDDEWVPVLPFEYWDYLHDHDHDGYAWYRIRFYLPSEMKDGLSGSDSQTGGDMYVWIKADDQ